MITLPELVFMLTLLTLASGAFTAFLYLNSRKPTNTRQHIKEIAGSWVWMLSLLFGAYWLGEMATAILIVLVAIKGVHEIAWLYLVHSKQVGNPKELASSKRLTVGLMLALLLMIASWLMLNQQLTADNQRPIMLFMLFVIQFNDVNQYIAGSLFGHKFFKRKLAATISPQKTIEGAMIGTLFTAGLAIPMGLLLTDFNVGVCFLLSLLLSGFGIIGDLFQSAVKRHHNVKDMGAWIKGHGGIMDRIDSLLFAVPVFLLVYLCFLTS